MRQFEVYANPDRDSVAFAPYLVVLSSHHLANLDAVIVAPLAADKVLRTTEIEIEVDFDGLRLILMMSDLFATESRRLRKRTGSLSNQEDEIRRALEKLFNGF